MSFLVESKTLNKKYTDKKMLVRDLITNKDEIILLKKAAIKKTDEVGYRIKESSSTAKADNGDNNPILQLGDTIHSVINTTNIIDSHDDLHLPGIWNKSVAEQNGKTFHLVGHNFDFSQIVGYPKNVSIEVRTLPWASLGKDYDGYTDALIFHTIMSDKTNPDVFKAYRDNDPVQHSIRMKYVNLSLAINDPEEKSYFDRWNTYYPSIANKEVADELGYFWAVSEAQIYKEGSTVLFGSNSETPYQGFTPNNAENKDNQQPSGSTTKKPLTNTEQVFDLSAAIQKTNFII
ncbi:hypothetical protein [Rhizosphaericola mali]|uniref:Uncharacterized protein n=1 Tax=Rhizosphaericola mali TaxID=2545455 RepID=A0A5P2G0Z5_9BACT|nr:hypothetical protein [Rhizosphaericola mali]QES88857.1 hypothetical protein E0W69_009385 [Rhizosphaericola mali]